MKSLLRFFTCLALTFPTPALAQGLEHFTAGYKAYERGDLDTALKHYTLAIEAGNLSGDRLSAAHYNRGKIYGHKGQYDRAIQDYSDATRLNPDYADAYNNRGIAYRMKGQYDRAIQDYSEAIRLKPNDARFYNNRGNVYRMKGQVDRAIQDYSDATRLNPDYADAYNNRGMAYRMKGQYDRAIQDYNETIRLKPNYAPAFSTRGYARFYVAQFVGAEEDLRRRMDLDPDPYAAIWLYLAQSRSGQDGKPELARNRTNLKHERLTGKIVPFYLGEVKADDLLAAAKNKDPQRQRENLCETYFYLGQHALLNNNLAEAIKLFRAAIDTQVTDFIEFTGAKAELERLVK